MNETVLDRITVNEQSSIRIAAPGCTVYLDPFRIGAEPHDAGLVCITHPHFDHFSPDDVAAVSGEGTVILYPASMQGEIDKLGIPAARLMPVTAGQTVTACGVTVEAVPAYNKLKPFHVKAKGWLGYILTVDGVRIYAAGDTDATKEAAAVSCDVALLPIGGTYTTNAAEAAKLADAITPAVVIPIHYGTVVGSPDDFDAFRTAVRKAKVVRKIGT